MLQHNKTFQLHTENRHVQNNIRLGWSPFTSWPSEGRCGVTGGTRLVWSDTLVGASLSDLRVLNPPTSLPLCWSRASARNQSIPPKLVGRSAHRSRKRRTAQERWRGCSKTHRCPCWSSPLFAVWTCQSIKGLFVLSVSPNEEIQSYQDLSREERKPHLHSNDNLLLTLYIFIHLAFHV